MRSARAGMSAQCFSTAYTRVLELRSLNTVSIPSRVQSAYYLNLVQVSELILLYNRDNNIVH